EHKNCWGGYMHYTAFRRHENTINERPTWKILGSYELWDGHCCDRTAGILQRPCSRIHTSGSSHGPHVCVSGATEGPLWLHPHPEIVHLEKICPSSGSPCSSGDI
ncbi:unnamed protein product, partial [Dicrocoelium dendriticum]